MEKQGLVKSNKIRGGVYKNKWFWIIIILLVMTILINLCLTLFNVDIYKHKNTDRKFSNIPPIKNNLVPEADNKLKNIYLDSDKKQPITEDIEKDQLTYEFSCNKTMGCDGATPEKCVENWLIKSGCISEKYRDLHYSNFRIFHENEFNFPKSLDIGTQYINEYDFDPIIKAASMKYIVLYDYIIDGEKLCRDTGSGYANNCMATVLKSGNKYYLFSFVGPLQEYGIKYTKEKVLDSMGLPPDNGIVIYTRDFFSNNPIDNYDRVKKEVINHNYGLYWNTGSPSEYLHCTTQWLINVDTGIKEKSEFCGT